jgi:hypothetical protein
VSESSEGATSDVTSSQESSSEATEAQTEGQDASSEGESSGESEGKETTQEKIDRLIKFKMNGKDHQFNLEDQKQLQDLIKLAQLGGGAHVKMQEAAELRKKTQDIEKMIKESPESLLKQYGLDPEQWAEQMIERKIQELEKSPEQREREKIQRELEDARRRLQEKEEQEQTREMEMMRYEAAQTLEKDILSGLEKAKSLPKSPYAIKRIADSMLWAMKNGFDDVSVEDIIPVVHNEIQKEIQDLLEQLPEDVMEQFIGKRSVDRMRETRLKKMSAPKATTAAAKVIPTGKDVNPDKKEPAKKISMKEFLKGSR